MGPGAWSPPTSIRAVVVNAGNANAATGAQGQENVRRTAAFAAEQLGCRPEQVLVASTGVIGHQLPMDNVCRRASAGLGQPLRRGGLSSHEAAQAIMTTDTRPKVVSRRQDRRAIDRAARDGQGGGDDRAPDGHDARLPPDRRPRRPDDLQAILSEAVESSFNCISVEGHTSTNDTVLVLANGAAGGEPLQGDGLAELRRPPFEPRVRRSPG